MTNSPLHSSQTAEWYTPPKIIELARKVLADIDLDPASNQYAQEWIKAKQYYTIANSGLNKPWFGNVWLNPPYGNRITTLWVNKLISDYCLGEVEQAIALLRPAVSSGWFNDLAKNYPRCETFSRIRFVDYQGKEQKSPTHGNIFFYLGTNTDKFVEVFSQIGICSKPIPIITNNAPDINFINLKVCQLLELQDEETLIESMIAEFKDKRSLFNYFIPLINSKLKQLNWSDFAKKDYLLRRYGARSLQVLSEENLIMFYCDLLRKTNISIPSNPIIS